MPQIDGPRLSCGHASGRCAHFIEVHARYIPASPAGSRNRAKSKCEPTLILVGASDLPRFYPPNITETLRLY